MITEQISFTCKNRNSCAVGVTLSLFVLHRQCKDVCSLLKITCCKFSGVIALEYDGPVLGVCEVPAVVNNTLVVRALTSV